MQFAQLPSSEPLVSETSDLERVSIVWSLRRQSRRVGESVVRLEEEYERESVQALACALVWCPFHLKRRCDRVGRPSLLFSSLSRSLFVSLPSLSSLSLSFSCSLLSIGSLTWRIGYKICKGAAEHRVIQFEPETFFVLEKKVTDGFVLPRLKSEHEVSPRGNVRRERQRETERDRERRPETETGREESLHTACLLRRDQDKRLKLRSVINKERISLVAPKNISTISRKPIRYAVSAARVTRVVRGAGSKPMGLA
jgi:hypothetical protein